MYWSGQSRYIGVFDTKVQAALAYEMIREKIKPPQVIVMEHNGLLSAVSTPKPKDPAQEYARSSAGATGAMVLPPFKSTRAITPSPTMVGDRHRPNSVETVAVASNVSSPLASQQQQNVTPAMHFGLSIGQYIPSAPQK